jgi:hypothetical protein
VSVVNYVLLATFHLLIGTKTQLQLMTFLLKGFSMMPGEYVCVLCLCCLFVCAVFLCLCVRVCICVCILSVSVSVLCVHLEGESVSV